MPGTVLRRRLHSTVEKYRRRWMRRRATLPLRGGQGNENMASLYCAEHRRLSVATTLAGWVVAWCPRLFAVLRGTIARSTHDNAIILWERDRYPYCLDSTPFSGWRRPIKYRRKKKTRRRKKEEEIIWIVRSTNRAIFDDQGKVQRVDSELL